MKVFNKILKATRHPFYTFYLIRQRLWLNWQKHRYAGNDITEPELVSNYGSGDLLEHFSTRQKPDFFFNPNNPPETDEPDIIIKQADRILRHKFHLFGVDLLESAEKINWHKDYINDYIWPDKFIADIKLDSSKKTDIKNVWEISRFYHLPVLGQAYLITEDTKYANEIINQITDWIEQNPVYYGPNWLCPMEAAIRICNWLFAWFLIRKAPVITNEFVSLFLASLKSHGDFIFRNLEKNPMVTGNHYLADLAGLAYLGILMPELKDSHRWRSFALKNLEKEIQRQVYPDGVNFEASIPYHRLATELFMYPAILFEINDIEISKSYRQRLEKMLEFTASYTQPDGTAPQIGDNDSGCLHTLTNYKNVNLNDHRYLLDIASPFSPEGLKTQLSAKPNESRAFPHGGIYIMRSKRTYCLIDCGTVGQNGVGGHAHNDTLSFVYTLDGLEFITDPGTGCYTGDSDMRNRFRSTAMHNTVRVDGCEINEFFSDSLFMMQNNDRPEVLQWQTSSDNDTLTAIHHGYNRLSDPVKHQRTVILDKQTEQLTVVDKMTCRKKHSYEWHLPLYPDVEKISVEDNIVFLKREMVVLKIMFEWDNARPIIIDSLYSPGYGIVEPSKMIYLVENETDQKKFSWNISVANS